MRIKAKCPSHSRALGPVVELDLHPGDAGPGRGRPLVRGGHLQRELVGLKQCFVTPSPGFSNMQYKCINAVYPFSWNGDVLAVEEVQPRQFHGLEAITH